MVQSVIFSNAQKTNSIHIFSTSSADKDQVLLLTFSLIRIINAPGVLSVALFDRHDDGVVASMASKCVCLSALWRVEYYSALKPCLQYGNFLFLSRVTEHIAPTIKSGVGFQWQQRDIETDLYLWPLLVYYRRIQLWVSYLSIGPLAALFVPKTKLLK